MDESDFLPKTELINANIKLDKRGESTYIVRVGNTGLTLTFNSKNHENPWLGDFIPEGRTYPLETDREDGTAKKYARVYLYALYYFLEWYDDKEDHIVTTGYTNERMAAFLVKNLGEQNVYYVKEKEAKKIQDENCRVVIDYFKLKNNLEVRALLLDAKNNMEENPVEMMIMGKAA